MRTIAILFIALFAVIGTAAAQSDTVFTCFEGKAIAAIKADGAFTITVRRGERTRVTVSVPERLKERFSAKLLGERLTLAAGKSANLRRNEKCLVNVTCPSLSDIDLSGVCALALFLKKRAPQTIWLSVALAVAGLYCLCITEDLTVTTGDFYVLLCSFCFAGHILIIDHFSPKTDGVKLSCMQFAVNAVLSGICMFLFEEPAMGAILDCWLPIGYTGILSCGVAYTLGIAFYVSKKHYMHFVFHLFVLLGSALQYFCVLLYCV